LGLDLEFAIQRERERASKPVLGDEFDTVTNELKARLDTLAEEVKDLAEIIEQFKKGKHDCCLGV